MVTLSVAVPTFNVTFTTEVTWRFTWIPVRAGNRPAFTLMSKVPMGTSGSRYVPADVEIATSVVPDFSSTACTLAPAITAPEESVTVPAMLPNTVCELDWLEEKSRSVMLATRILFRASKISFLPPEKCCLNVIPRAEAWFVNSYILLRSQLRLLKRDLSSNDGE